MKEFDFSFTSLSFLFPESSVVLMTIPKWYSDPFIIKKIIEFNRDEINRNNYIGGVIPVLYYMGNEMEEFEKLLKQLTFFEQLFLVNPRYFPFEDSDNINNFYARSEVKAALKETLEYVLDNHPKCAGWRDKDTFLVLQEDGYSVSGKNDIIFLLNYLFNKDVSDGKASIFVDSNFLEGEVFSKGYFDINDYYKQTKNYFDYISKSINKIIFINTDYYDDNIVRKVSLINGESIQFLNIIKGEKSYPLRIQKLFDAIGVNINNETEYVTKIKKLMSTVFFSISLDKNSSEIQFNMCGRFERVYKKHKQEKLNNSSKTINAFKQAGLDLKLLDNSESYDYIITFEKKKVENVFITE